MKMSLTGITCKNVESVQWCLGSAGLALCLQRIELTQGFIDFDVIDFNQLEITEVNKMINLLLSYDITVQFIN